MTLKRVAVIGGGLMGHGIAQVCAQAGCTVRLMDVSAERVNAALQMIGVSLDRMVRAGKLDEAEKAAVLHRVTGETAIASAVADAEVVIEAVPENLELKRKIFAQLDEFAPPGAILATNTSELSVTAIAAATKRPDMVVGMHWFNPPQVMKLIEVVVGVGTADAITRAISEFSAHLGKEVVVVKDVQGFVTSRAVALHIIEGIRMYEEGVASREDIDKGIRLGLNYPMGPLELADYLGLDTMLYVVEGLTEAFGDRFRPPQTLRKLVEAGHLGRKTGRGFYTYAR